MAIYARRSGSQEVAGILNTVLTNGSPIDGYILVWSDELQSFVIQAPPSTLNGVSNTDTFGGANVYTIDGGIISNTLWFKQIIAGTGINLEQDDESLTITSGLSANLLSVPDSYRITIDNDNDNSTAKFEIWRGKSTGATNIDIIPPVGPQIVQNVYSGNDGSNGYFETLATDFNFVGSGYEEGQFIFVNNAGDQTGEWVIDSVYNYLNGVDVYSRISLTVPFTGAYAFNLGGPKPDVEFITAVLNIPGPDVGLPLPYDPLLQYKLQIYDGDFGPLGENLVAGQVIQITGSDNGYIDGNYTIDTVTAKGAGPHDYSELLFSYTTPISTAGIVLDNNTVAPELNITIDTFEEATGFYVNKDGSVNAEEVFINDAPTQSNSAVTKAYADALIGGTNTQIQYNNNGVFAGDTGFTTDGSGSVDIVGDLDVDNLNLNGTTITANDGTTNTDLILTTTGSGLVVATSGYDMSSGPDYAFATKDYVDVTATSVSGVPGGTTTQIQYNNAGVFAGDTGFVTDGSGNVDITGSLDIDNININGNTLSSTDTDGDVIISPDGSGLLVTYSGYDMSSGPDYAFATKDYIDGLVGGSGDVSNASNLGGDQGWFTTKAGGVLQFKGITAGDNIGLVSGANEVTVNVAASGTTTQIQYNNNGAFAGDTGFVTDGSGNVDITGSLDIDNININGNTLSSTDLNGDLILTTNGEGSVVIGEGSGSTSILEADGTDTNINLQLVAKGTGLVIAESGYDMSSGPDHAFATKDYVDAQVITPPSGTNTQIQYNNNGVFAGDTGFTTDGSGALTVTGSLDIDNININGNTLSSTDTDGDVIISPDGSGLLITYSGYDMSSGPNYAVTTKDYVDGLVDSSTLIIPARYSTTGTKDMNNDEYCVVLGANVAASVIVNLPPLSNVKNRPFYFINNATTAGVNLIPTCNTTDEFIGDEDDTDGPGSGPSVDIEIPPRKSLVLIPDVSAGVWYIASTGNWGV